MSGAHNGNGDVAHTKDNLFGGESGHNAHGLFRIWYQHNSSGRRVPHGIQIAEVTRVNGVRTVTYTAVQNSSDYSYIGMNTHD